MRWRLSTSTSRRIEEIGHELGSRQHGEDPLVVTEDHRADVVERALAGGHSVEQVERQVEQLVALELEDELIDGSAAVGRPCRR